MHEQNNENVIQLPHHEQQSLCTTRLPYRQGRKLTAVKVYSISKESNHLLIFGVPSLNLRQETKALFIKFGKLTQFIISKKHAAESFTDTYHAQYERIQSARHAKRMLDTKNFYGGLLHVCYAPELEDIKETRQKLMQRQRDVIFRLKNLNNEQNNPSTATATKEAPKTDILNNKIPQPDDINKIEPIKLNMGDINIIYSSKQEKKINRKRKLLLGNANNIKNYQPCFLDDKLRNAYENNERSDNITADNNYIKNKVTVSSSEVKYNHKNNATASNISGNHTTDIEVIDCTGVNDEVITNINEYLNYDKFGGEIIRKVPEKPINKIQFHLNRNS